MMPTDDALQRRLDALPRPVLIVQTRVGKGNVTVADALRERLPAGAVAACVSIEDHLPALAVREDLHRYRFVSNRLPWLLTLIYRIPFFYWRKRVRERLLGARSLTALRALIEKSGARSVIAVSHRPAFWLSSLKRATSAPFFLCGVQTEFGPTLGWRYVFWDAVNAFVSPVRREELSFPFPASVDVVEAPPLVRRRFHEMAAAPGDPDEILMIAGFWGQISVGRAAAVIQTVIDACPTVRLTMICGTNAALRAALEARFRGHARVRVLGAVETIDDHLRACAAVITKPGFSTIVESWAAGRPLFLLKGMPVAEDHNAAFALRHFGAQWFSPDAFRRWHAHESGRDHAAK